jgi:RNA polymerase sigma-70 factor (ECF subfamily)
MDRLDGASCVEAFLAARKAPWPGDRADLAARIKTIVRAAREAWPELDIDALGLARHLGALCADALPDASRGGDLYLALACGRGEPRALALFKRRYEGRIVAALHRMRASAVAEEVVADVLGRLLSGERPGILGYAGKGELGKWLAVTALRDAYRALRELRRRERVERPSSDSSVIELAGEALPPDLQGLKERYQAEVKLAFARAFATLAARERVLLRYQYLDALGIDDVARILGTSRATAARWRAAARERLATATRDELRTRLALDPQELESILGLVRSQLDVSLTGLLRADEARERDDRR